MQNNDQVSILNNKKRQRSYNMSMIRSKDTKPEIKLRSIIHKEGFRFRLHKKNLPGKPDIVFSSRKKVIFLHGCFWHRHKGCKYATDPKSNIEFWNKKFETNLARDEKVLKNLEKIRWETLVIWECELKNTNALLKKIHHFLD